MLAAEVSRRAIGNAVGEAENLVVKSVGGWAMKLLGVAAIVVSQPRRSPLVGRMCRKLNLAMYKYKTSMVVKPGTMLKASPPFCKIAAFVALF